MGHEVSTLTPIADSPYQRQAQTLQALRRSRGLSKYQVIKDTKIAKPVYYGLESGERLATPETLERLAEVFTSAEIEEIRQAAAQDLVSKKGLADTETLPVEDQPGHLGLSLNQLIQEFDGVAAWQKRIRDLDDHDKLKLRDVLARTLEQMDEEAKTRKRTTAANHEP